MYVKYHECEILYVDYEHSYKLIKVREILFASQKLQTSLFGVTSDKINAEDDNCDDNPPDIHLAESRTVKTKSHWIRSSPHTDI
jgi:hypothetical protein